MTASALQPISHAPVSVVICGATLVNTYRALQTDFGTNICLSADLPSGMQAAENLAPSVLIVGQEALHEVDLSTMRVRLALGPSVRVLVSISPAPDDHLEDHLKELLRSGIAGFVERDGPPSTVRHAIECVASGEIWAPRRIVGGALRAMVSVVDDPRFTRRELEILRRIAAGEDNRQIAESLFISRETVRWHLRSAYGKLGIHDRHIAVELMRHPA